MTAVRSAFKEGDRVVCIRAFKMPYRDRFVEKDAEGVVYGVGPCWDQPGMHVGIYLDNGQEVSLPFMRAALHWRIIK